MPKISPSNNWESITCSVPSNNDPVIDPVILLASSSCAFKLAIFDLDCKRVFDNLAFSS